MANTVISLKLSTGEEIVCELVKRTGDVNSNNLDYVVKRPHILQFQQVAPGQIGLAFMPWTLSNPTISELHIPKANVVAEFEPSDKVAKEYLSQTSGISLDTSALRM